MTSDIVYENVSHTLIGIWVILNVAIIANGGSLLAVGIACVIGYIFTGPWAVEIAKEHGYSCNVAFLCAGFFNIIGFVIYWIYVQVRGR